MKEIYFSRNPSYKAFAFMMALAASIFSSRSPAQEAKPVGDSEAAKVQELIKEIQGKLPSQAHAMADVAYHFSNLWFAAGAENWPLASFYANETKSHLKWAVRLKPVRSLSGGGELHLADVLSTIEGTAFKEVEESLKAKDKVRFQKGYKVMLASCYSCHVLAEKPYLRLQVPERPPETLIEFRPEPASPLDAGPIPEK